MEALLQETTWAGDRVDTPDALMAVGWQKGSQHMGMGTRHLQCHSPRVGAPVPGAEALGHSRNPSNAFLGKEVTGFAACWHPLQHLGACQLRFWRQASLPVAHRWGHTQPCPATMPSRVRTNFGDATPPRRAAPHRSTRLRQPLAPTAG